MHVARRLIRRPLALCLAVLLLIALAACGGHGGAQMQLSPKPDVTAASGDMGKALAELEALPVPQGADPAQFKELKLKLREMLLSKSGAKLAAAAPSSNRSKVGLFTMAGSGGTGHLAWSYRSEGDFNLDGIVGVSDLTPLGINFSKSSTSSDWASARAADGNNDGLVSVSDLVSIGANFLRRVEGYHLQYSATLTGGSWATSVDIPFGSSNIPAGVGRRDYLIDITSGLQTGYYRVVPYDGASDGIPSDAAAYPATNYYESEPNDDGAGANILPSLPFPAPQVDGNLGVGNTFGDVDGDDTDIFYCQAPEAGTLDFTLALDGALGDIDLFLFQQGVTDPIASSRSYGDAEHVSSAVTGATYYYVMVKIYSGYGEYRLAGTFTPQGANQPPSAALTPQPSSGAAPLAVTLNAGASTDDGTIVKYEFDFGEGGGFQDYGSSNSAAHTYSNAGGFTAQVRVTDNGGLSDTATAQVNVTGGGAGSISGTVLTDGGPPLAGVTVVLSDGVTYISANTNASGYYQFLAVSPGTYSVTPSLEEDTFDPGARSGIVVGGAAVTGQDFTAHFYSSNPRYGFLAGTPPNQVVAHPALGTTIDVYVENGSGGIGWNQAMTDAVYAAVPRWNLVGDTWGLFHIQFTTNKDIAEIYIHWVNTLGDGVLGLATWSGHNGQIDLPMDIQLATSVYGNPVDGPTEEKGAIHEVGHTLGLWDHSDQDTDIMYPVASQSTPSPRDMWTIYSLYHTTPDWTTGGRHGSSLGQGYMEFSIE
jgi:hypothetical protein